MSLHLHLSLSGLSSAFDHMHAGRARSAHVVVILMLFMMAALSLTAAPPEAKTQDTPSDRKPEASPLKPAAQAQHLLAKLYFEKFECERISKACLAGAGDCAVVAASGPASDTCFHPPSGAMPDDIRLAGLADRVAQLSGAADGANCAVSLVAKGYTSRGEPKLEQERSERRAVTACERAKAATGLKDCDPLGMGIEFRPLAPKQYHQRVDLSALVVCAPSR